MLRRALAESMKRINLLNSDSSAMVDRRIVVKLLVTFFERKQSREVLTLMSRMLGFSGKPSAAWLFYVQICLMVHVTWTILFEGRRICLCCARRGVALSCVGSSKWGQWGVCGGADDDKRRVGLAGPKKGVLGTVAAMPLSLLGTGTGTASGPVSPAASATSETLADSWIEFLIQQAEAADDFEASRSQPLHSGELLWVPGSSCSRYNLIFGWKHF
jgi:hypothetical protein